MAGFEGYKIVIPGIGGLDDMRALIAVSIVRKNPDRPLSSIYAQCTADSIGTKHDVGEDLEGLKACLRAAGDQLMHRIDEKGQVFLAVKEDVLKRGDLARWLPGVETKLTIGD